MSGAVDSLLASMGAVLEPEDRLPYDLAVAAVRAGLGETAFARERTAGAALSLGEACTEALAVL